LTNVSWPNRYGLAYASWGRTDAAILTLGRAAERFPDEPAVYTALGRVWLQDAESRNDRIALGKALEALQPPATAAAATPAALMLYGRALFLAGNLAAAERLLLQATARSPVEPAAFRYLADAAERLGHLAEAHDALRRYVALVGENEVEPAVSDRLIRLQQRRSRAG
jgi:predicted Zn-dependent protease